MEVRGWGLLGSFLVTAGRSPPATGTAGGREPSAAGPLRHGQGPVPSPEWPTFNDEEPRGYKDLAPPSRVRNGLRGRPSLTAFGVWAKACMDAMPQLSLSGCCPCPALPGCRREPRYRPPRHCFGDPACPPEPWRLALCPSPPVPCPRSSVSLPQGSPLGLPARSQGLAVIGCRRLRRPPHGAHLSGCSRVDHCVYLVIA